MIPAGVAYLQAPYHDELSDFRITPSPGGPMLDHRYQDDSANMVYGYVSSPYGTTNPAGKWKSNQKYMQKILNNNAWYSIWLQFGKMDLNQEISKFLRSK